jgi:hypothetical protein
MTRDEFLSHIRERVDESIRRCEEDLRLSLPRQLAFQWLSPKNPRVTGAIEEEICREVFVGPEKIYPCIDIGPWSKESDGRLLICGLRAGYQPAPFGKNWKGEDGPFILVRGGDFAR